MRRLTPILLAGTLLSSPVLALDYCAITPDDANVRVCTYSPNQRYVVKAPVGFPVNLRFGEAERIKRTEFAYSGIAKDGTSAQTWKGPSAQQGGASGAAPANRYQNNLPIWPLQEGHSSLVLVTVAPDGITERPYQFDLTALPASADDRNMTASLSFTYPADDVAAAKKAADDKKQIALAAWKARQDKASEIRGLEKLKVDVFYGEQNKAYRAKGETKYKYLAPSKISDNGFLTEMQWPGNVQIPTISMIDPATGEERTLTPDTQGPMQVIAQTAEWFRLRLGHDAVLDIHNLAWKPTRPDPRTGTTSPEVQRRVTYRDEK